MADRTVLISGAGIAGATLAYWLARHGYRPTLVEIAPALPQGGYMIDFWGVGYDVAEKMGLIPTLRRAGYDIGEVRLVDKHGATIGGFDARLLQSAARDRFFSIRRGDLAREIFRTIEGKAETIFGDRVTAIQQDDAGVAVSFEKTPARRFDLVVGADGLHSAVRHLQFGDDARFEKHLGYYVASFGIAGYPHRDENAYVSYTVPGRQLARYALRGNRTVCFFIWAEDSRLDIDRHDTDAQKDVLRERFRDGGWECDAILDALDACDNLYFDAVSQIRMPAWSRNRVALVGDAAYCPSLLAGEGSAFAMSGAYILAGELHRAGTDHRAALHNYEQTFRPFIDDKQRSVLRLGHWFAPRSSVGLLVRNQITRMMSWPWIGGWLAGNLLDDRFSLPTYQAEPRYSPRSRSEAPGARQGTSF